VIRAAAALFGRQHAVWVDFALEPVEERLARIGSHAPPIVAGVHRVSRDARPQAALLRR
jgi:hypothetical protein